MKRTFGDLIGIGAGAATAAMVAFVLSIVHALLGFSLYALTIFFVVPIGAIIAGALAAGGYYLAFEIFEIRPTKLLLVTILMVSAGAFLLTHFFDYRFIEIDGVSISRLITFPKYLDTTIRSSSLSLFSGFIPSASTGELGSLGYVFAVLQILGFSLGGIAVYRSIADNPYCDRCSRYYGIQILQERFFENESDQIYSKTRTAERIEAGDCQAAVDEHGSYGERAANWERQWKTVVTVKGCDTCDGSWIRLDAEDKLNGDWRASDTSPVTRFTNDPITQRT